jgi:hypothetical protein
MGASTFVVRACLLDSGFRADVLCPRGGDVFGSINRFVLALGERRMVCSMRRLRWEGVDGVFVSFDGDLEWHVEFEPRRIKMRSFRSGN